MAIVGKKGKMMSAKGDKGLKKGALKFPRKAGAAAGKSLKGAYTHSGKRQKGEVYR